MIATRWARVPPIERGVTLGDFLVPIRVGERAATWQRDWLMMGIGALLGLRRSLGSVLLYLLLGIVGLPVFAFNAQSGQYASGLDTIVHLGAPGFSLGPTGGYLVGFIFAAALVGRLAELGWDRRIGGAVVAMVLGNLVVYLIGVPWLMAAAHQSVTWSLQNGLYPFLPGDLLKIAVGASILAIGWWVVRRRSTPL